MEECAMDAQLSSAAAARMLAACARLLARARAAGIALDDEQAAIDALLDREIKVPGASDEECRRYYDAHQKLFIAGEIVFARHILFAVTSGGPVDDVRRQAERTLNEVAAHRDRFESVAAKFSNCPSGAQGGALGRLARGETVPEFEQAVFGSALTGVLPHVVRTRYGFHVVAVDRREPGRLLPFDAVREAIARHLESRAEERAVGQYLQLLMSDEEGGAFESAPLVQ
jgi:peptidyl-prolyl cis-trans isomerase C